MALPKQPVDIRFGDAGLDQKKDPKQVYLGRFLRLVNAVFDKGGRLTKRFGFADLTTLPSDVTPSVLSTFLASLVAVGSRIAAYSASSKTWTEIGHLVPLTLDTLALARPNATVTQCDVATAPAVFGTGVGLTCAVFTTGSGYFYTIADASTGATIIPATAIPTSATIDGAPKVFVLGRYFVIVFSAVITATHRLQFVAISRANPASVTTAADLTLAYTPAGTTAWDGVVANNSLYLAWNGSDMGGAVRMTYLDQTLTQHTTVAFATETGTVFGLAADTSGSTPIIYTTYWNSTPLGRVLAVSATLTTVLAPTTFAAVAIGNLAPYATSGHVQITYEMPGHYTYDSALANSILKSVTVTQAGVVGTTTTVVQGAGLASKAFLLDETVAVLSLYSGRYETGYFLLNATTGQVLCKLAYSNAVFATAADVGYLIKGLPSVSLVDGTYYLGYLRAAQIQPVNRTLAQTTPGVYISAGVNLAAFTPDAIPQTAEIGGSLLIAAGRVSLYDGTNVVEQGFNVWPDEVEATTSTTGGLITDGVYYYVATYEWTDAQGLLHRSAGSVPISITAAGGNTSTNTVKVPTLRLTDKTGVRVVLYRWSQTQQTFYQAASASNSMTVSFLTFTDTLANSSIIGNAILYTTGQVENIGAPPSNVIALYRNRVMLVDAEDQNSVWYSKVVQEQTPVELSDVFTIFCSPTIGAQGSTGPVRAMASMDDKLILFKKDAAYYETGQGPNAAGGLNDFQDPVFITSAVGCSNPQSVVLSPAGLIFQSDKGRWLLGRDLSTKYVGAAVDDYNDLTDTSALAIPGTNQIRISTAGGPILVYDYFYDQWATFSPQIASSCIADGVHTTLDQYGRIRQEAADTYVDGSDPVLLGFTTGWGNLAGLQGYQRAYFLYLEGQYFSPFKLTVGLAYDYNEAVVQQVTVLPDAPNGAYGDDPTYGAGTPYGGANNGVFEPRIFLERQRCEAFQVTVQEYYDPAYGVPAGEGLNLSGMTAVVGVKKGYRTNSAASSFG